MNLRPPGPEGADAESHSVSGGGSGSQVMESTRDASPAVSHQVAPSGLAATPYGAPVVRSHAPDLGPHERLLKVRDVADRLNVCSALVYRLCERGELPSLRIGGALRFQAETVDAYAALCAQRGDATKTGPHDMGAGA